jgi:hypothetical protein
VHTVDIFFFQHMKHSIGEYGVVFYEKMVIFFSVVFFGVMAVQQRKRCDSLFSFYKFSLHYLMYFQYASS